MIVASYADILLARHALLPNAGEDRLCHEPKECLRGRLFMIADTVNSPLPDTLVSGQLYLRMPFQIPLLPPSQTLYLHIPVSRYSLLSGRGHLKMKIAFFFCLRSLANGHNSFLALKFVFNLPKINKSALLFDRVTEQWGSVLSNFHWFAENLLLLATQ